MVNYRENQLTTTYRVNKNNQLPNGMIKWENPQSNEGLTERINYQINY